MSELTIGNFNPANDDVMRRLLQDAGIEPGMAILDAGSGPGDVSFLAAELTGPSGTVVGLDHNARAVQMATARSRELGVEHRVRFEEADLAHPASDGLSVDALIGRRVLMYLLVAQRMREMGIRLALGAQPAEVILLVLRKGLLLTGCGVTLGLLASRALASALVSQLSGVREGGVVLYGGVAAVLVAASALACVIPALRAGSTDPLIALRQD